MESVGKRTHTKNQIHKKNVTLRRKQNTIQAAAGPAAQLRNKWLLKSIATSKDYY